MVTLKVLHEFIYNKEFVKRTGKPGHHYVKEYEKTKLFCPECGTLGLWVCNDGGDFYLGRSFVCESCGHRNYLDGGSTEEPGVVEQLKTRITKTPTTPRGN